MQHYFSFSNNFTSRMTIWLIKRFCESECHRRGRDSFEILYVIPKHIFSIILQNCEIRNRMKLVKGLQ